MLKTFPSFVKIIWDSICLSSIDFKMECIKLWKLKCINIEKIDMIKYHSIYEIKINIFKFIKVLF